MEGSLYPKVLGIRWRWDGDTGDYITYLNPKLGNINILNPVAATIFKLCDGKTSVNDIVEKLYQEYDAPSVDIIRKDVEDFLNFMSKNQIIKLLADS
ncbi:PqqD family protein [Alkaliphilus crotonatoxidans]